MDANPNDVFELSSDGSETRKPLKKPEKIFKKGLTNRRNGDIIIKLTRASETAPNLENDTEMTNAIKKTVIPNELKLVRKLMRDKGLNARV